MYSKCIEKEKNYYKNKQYMHLPLRAYSLRLNSLLINLFWKN